jgi:hypothetical protein
MVPKVQLACTVNHLLGGTQAEWIRQAASVESGNSVGSGDQSAGDRGPGSAERALTGLEECHRLQGGTRWMRKLRLLTCGAGVG